MTTLVIGLGNPGKKYELTRHNAGFLFLDWLVKEKFPGSTFSLQKNMHTEICEVKQGPGKLILGKPQTYMNNSGHAVSQLVSYYKIDFEKDLLIIQDEVDLPIGQLRESLESASAGHKGVQSIIDALGSKNFKRLRIGVEAREDKSIPPTENYVLQKFSEEELKLLETNIWPKLAQKISNANE